MASSVLADLTSTLTSALSNLPPPDKIQDGERMQLLGVLSQLQAALEPPQLPVQRFCFSHYGIVVIRVAQGMGIFDAFVESEGSEMSLKELSSKVKGDEKLLKRVMRFLSTQQIFKQTATESYKPLPLAMTFGKGSFPGDLIKHFHNNMQVTVKLFEYFELNGYKNPEDIYDAPFQLAYNTKSHYFEWLTHNPTAQQAFNSVMTQSQQFRGADWFDIYPVQENLRVSPDQVLLVDIGGGVGHDLMAFKKRFPDLPGKLILQDLPQVIDTIKDPLLEGITATGHSMLDPQPIRGARAYYMRTVLHDFPDKQALEALARIREAMTEDSSLFIHEHLMTDGLDVPPIAATLDFHMMEIFSSLERTEKEWVALLEKAGFRIVNVWNETSAGQPSALFEAVL
ncbi:Demethylsterigmatocystin 6-O-methyltransferase [Talaromyces islandicus]|uniref:Demethylsterigmatocystin 6-O-methyltransferase n=1 Tax=Talaromyces islandicus TaxID=28573 RepID=A0A0U1M720_TALIS|nr:Demethylsterigmatocystin 6-O-methyltransferase [Talaromyces islandicus]